MNDRPDIPRPAPGKRISIALAIAVHAALAIFLIFGVQWQSERAATVEVDLVRSTPVAPAADRPEPPKPEPKPEPRPEPKPEPKPAPPPKPDIAVKEKEKPKPPKEEPKPYNPLEALKNEVAKLARPDVTSAAERELAQRKSAEAAAARDKAAALWADRIAAKIKRNIMRPASASGNPEAIYEITLLPDGSIVGEPRLKQSTGNPALDSAIERAIRKSDPLPKPDDPSVFQRILVLRFRPLEE